ncbi:hypothetical protein BVI434_4490001 [Burkholderia vietnamiensis]|nr:hypothetical protein BVI434_4490001 [Burkholderia vietnamiensis]
MRHPSKRLPQWAADSLSSEGNAQLLLAPWRGAPGTEKISETRCGARMFNS